MKRLLLPLLLCLALLLGACGTTAPAETPASSAEPAPETAVPEPTPEPPSTEPDPVPPGTILTVSTVDALLENLGPDRTIRLAAGSYDFSQASDYGVLDTGSPYYRWLDVGDGYELVLHDLSGLTIEGAGIDVSLLCTEPRYADVVSFRSCTDVKLCELTVGHTEEVGACAGGVLDYLDCRGCSVYEVSLYGCGILGISATHCRELTAERTEIYDCSQGAVWLRHCEGVYLNECTIHWNEAWNLLSVWDCKGFCAANTVFDSNTAASLLYCVNSEQAGLYGCRVSNNRFMGDSMFLLDNADPVVDRCAFTGNDGRFYPGGPCLKALSPDGDELQEADLAAMDYEPVAGLPGWTLSEPLHMGEGRETREVHVSTVEELLSAIAPDTAVYLDGEDFDLTRAGDYGGEGGAYYVWEECYDGFQLTLKGLSNFHLIGQGVDRTRLVTTPRYADVLCFEDGMDLSVEGLTLGHSKGPGTCAGNVLGLRYCSAVSVKDCGLFGCGVVGVSAEYSSALTVTGTEIYDCQSFAAYLTSCADVSFSDCSIHNCGINRVGCSDCDSVTFDDRIVA